MFVPVIILVNINLLNSITLLGLGFFEDLLDAQSILIFSYGAFHFIVQSNVHYFV